MLFTANRIKMKFPYMLVCFLLFFDSGDICNQTRKALDGTYLSDNHIFQDITTESTQQDIVAATVRNEVISKKPVSKSYLSAFMKLYMAKVVQLK